jgi:hypothetical protein
VLRRRKEPAVPKPTPDDFATGDLVKVSADSELYEVEGYVTDGDERRPPMIRVRIAKTRIDNMFAPPKWVRLDSVERVRELGTKEPVAGA